MDLAMCKNNDCPKNKSCLRYMGEPIAGITSYIVFKTICKEKNNFEWFVKISDTDKVRVEEIEKDQEVKVEQTQESVIDQEQSNSQ